MTKTILFCAATIFLISSVVSSAVLKGTIVNASTNTPIAFATISSSQNSQTIMTNEDGGFILYLDYGTTNINCSHIAYYSLQSEINIDKDTVEIEIILNPSLIVLPSIKVYERNYDAAQAIIIEAIRNKDKILAKLNSYNFDAYTKLLVWNASNPDSLKPMYVTETELTAYWKYPSEYKEIITARKQSSNLEAENNLVSIGEVLNFNNNRINFGPNSLVSPTAKDALDYYNYYLLDTLFYDSLPVYLLEIEPKSNTTPLFIGTIQINAHSYEIMGVDFTVNEGLDSPYLKKFNMVQEYNLFDNEYWMPTIIKYDVTIEIPFPLIPTISFSYTAALQRYTFKEEYGDTIFNDYILEVDDNVDDYDTTQWLANRFIPLTVSDELAYDHIDSVKQNKPLYKKLLPIIPGALFAVTHFKDFFHFNRVEGAYLGGNFEIASEDNRLISNLKLGYAFDAELWQQTFSVNYKLSKKHRWFIEPSYHNNIQTRKTLNSPTNGNATVFSLLLKQDPYDYYREKGFKIKTSIAPFKQTSFSVSYIDFRQFSISNNTNYSLRHKDSTYQENLPITNGTMRSLNFDFQYDSNKRMKIKGKEQSIFSYPYTIFRVGTEISDPSLLNSDFEFATAYGQFYTSRQFLGLGVASLGIYGTTKLSGHLPSQRYTTMDFGGNILDKDMTFKTLYSTNFSASDLLSIYYSHNFGTKLFKKLNIPLLKKIPYSITFNGGIFWSELKGNTYNMGLVDKVLYF